MNLRRLHFLSGYPALFTSVHSCFEGVDSHGVHADGPRPQDIRLWGVTDEQDLLGAKAEFLANAMKDFWLWLDEADLKRKDERIRNAWEDS
ncbi:hypothetical protein BIWAKO_06666 [Bosea sp. BIWAKO-01]|nr:hypothetical protein BIWAKO_06666 [Bosea sp. BIWAKO-01]